MGSQVGLSVGHHLSACLYVLPSFLLVLLPPGPCSLASLAPRGQPGLELQREFRVIWGHMGNSCRAETLAPPSADPPLISAET